MKVKNNNLTRLFHKVYKKENSEVRENKIVFILKNTSKDNGK